MKKNYKLTKTNSGYHLEVDTTNTKSRDLFHFQHQLHNRAQVVEDKRKKKARYKEDYLKDC